MNTLTSITGLLPEEITSGCRLSASFRGRQIFKWIYSGAAGFESMTNLPAALRTELETEYRIYSTQVLEEYDDKDGTSKILVGLEDGLRIEAVVLTDKKGRRTACISSQAGCAMGCRFCRTAGMGLKRNLTPGEIVEQYLHLSRLYGEISNIVFMGMGEPLNNYDAVKKAVGIFTHQDGPALSPRRITVSTCGLAEGIKMLTEDELKVRLAVSLVTADSAKRTSIMPVTARNSLDNLKKALTAYQDAGGKRITLECVVLGGINDSSSDAVRIAKWAAGLNVVVNVIPWNPAAGLDFREPSEKAVEAFCAELEKHGLPITRRYRRGRGVNAACGQLAT